MLPERVTAGSQKEIWWKCGRGHSWKAKLMDRSRGTGCPYCCNRKVLRGENDLASIHPELLPEWDYQKNGGIRPDCITYQSRKKVWWFCVKGHSWKAEIFQRVNGGTGCPVCARRKDRHPVRAGETDLLTVNPELASEWDHERKGRFLQGKCGGSVTGGITGSARFRSGNAEPAVRFATEEYTGSQD